MTHHPSPAARTGNARSCPARPRAGGFTLIELMVVIGIIALLIALLMPSLSRARAQAKTTVCASQLHQIFEGSVAWGARTEGAEFPAAGWTGALRIILPNANVFICPEADATAEDYSLAAGYVVHVRNTNFDIPCVPGPWSHVINGNPDSFTLSMEDQGGQGGGDFSYGNIVLSVTDNHNGTITITVKPSGGSYSDDLLDAGTRQVVLANIGGSGATVNASITVPGTRLPTNYGLNSALSTTVPIGSSLGRSVMGNGYKIFGLDYPATLALPDTDDWSQPFFRNTGGDLSFARHNGKFNVIYADGSVRLEFGSSVRMNPAAAADIVGAPPTQHNRDIYWEAN